MSTDIHNKAAPFIKVSDSKYPFDHLWFINQIPLDPKYTSTENFFSR